jgi:hypothetical protein
VNDERDSEAPDLNGTPVIFFSESASSGDNPATATRKIRVSKACPQFNQKLSERSWTKRIAREVQNDSSAIVGVALT